MSETTLTPNNTTVSQLLGNTVGVMSFRIRGGEHSGRILRIRAQKCTIGSAADCTLRLNAPGVGALHCLILRGEAGVVARRWANNTLLNGGTFSDALLTLGDRLQIGPLELEFLGDAAETSAPVETTKATRITANSKLVHNETARPELGNVELAKQLTYVRFASKQKLRRCKKRISQLKQRLQQIEKAYHKTQNERDRFQDQVQFAEEYRRTSEQQIRRLTSESNAQTLTLERVRQELEESRRTLLHQNENWLQAKQEWQEQLLARDREISAVDTTTAELRRTISQKQLENEAWKVSQAELLSTRAQYEQATQACQKSQAAQARMQSELDQLQTRIHDLTQALSTATSTDVTLNTLQHELITAQQQQRECKQQLETLQAAYLESQECVKNLQQKLAISEQKNEQLVQVQLEYEAKTNALQTELAAQHERLQVQSNLLDDWKNRYTQIEQQHAQDLAVKLADSTKSSTQLAELQQQIAALQSALAAQPTDQTAKSDDYVQQLATREKELTLAKTQLDQLRLELETSQAVHAKSETTLQNRIHVLEKLAANLEQELRNSAITSGDAEISQASFDHTTWETERQALQEQLQAAESLRAEWESRYSQLFAERSEILAESKQRENLLAQVRQEQQQQLEACEAERAQLVNVANTTHLATTHENTEMAERLAEKAAEIEQMRLELVQRDSDLAQIRQEVLTEMQTWQMERQSLQQALAEAQANVSAISQPELPQALYDTNNDVVEPELTQAVPEIDVVEPHDESSLLNERYPDLMQWQQNWKESCPSPNEDSSLLPNHLEEQLETANEASNDSESSEYRQNESLYDNHFDKFAEEPSTDIEPAPAPESTQHSATFSEVLARLGAAGILKSENGITGPEPENGRSLHAGYTAPKNYTSAPQEEEQSSTDESVHYSGNYTAHSYDKSEPMVNNQQESRSAPTPAPAATEDSVGNDDSIEDYMARLLKRVRGDSVAEAFTQKNTAATPAAIAVQSTVPVMSQEQTVHDANPEPLKELKPRAEAPELNVDLTGLRQLAVSSARQAVDMSSIREQRQELNLLVFASLCAYVTFAVLMYYAVTTFTLWAAYAALGALGLGVLWTMKRLKKIKLFQRNEEFQAKAMQHRKHLNVNNANDTNEIKG